MESTNNSSKIGVLTATIIGINAMIGAGIFTAPAILAHAKIGPAVILTYLFVVASVWFIAQSLARVAARFPEEGSFYAYAKQWGGHALGVIASTAYLMGILMAMGLLATYVGIYLNGLFPSISAKAFGFWSVIAIILLNMVGVIFSQLGQRILVFCTLLPILTTIIMCLTKADLSLLKPFMPYGISSVFQASRLVVFGFFGFECASALFNIVKNPQKNVPKALTYSILVVGTLYILFIGSIIISTPLHLFVSAETPLPEVLRSIFPTHGWLIKIIHISTLSAMLGTIHSVVWSCSNLIVTLFKKLKGKTAKALVSSGIINQRTAVLLAGTMILVAFFSIKNIDLFFYLAAIFIVFAYVTSMISLLFVKEEWKSGQNIKTLIGIATGLVIFGFALQGIIKMLA